MACPRSWSLPRCSCWCISYTDGVTETNDRENVLYSEERLLAALNTLAGVDSQTVCRRVKADRARLECAVTPVRVTVRFVDNGKPYDPTQQAEPDVTLSAEERGIGGLGILMVKKSMGGVEYTYENGQNILTLWKNR